MGRSPHTGSARISRFSRPILNVDKGFLVQFANGGRRYFVALQSLGNILHPAHGDTGKVHSNERFLHATLSLAIPINDGCFK